MLYEFEDPETGQVIDLEYRIGQAPKIGSCVQVGENLYRRIPSRPVLPDVVGGCRRGTDRHFTSQSLPEWVEGAPRYDMDPKSKTYGCAQFASAKEVREFTARKKDTPGEDGLVYDGKI
jgi:hypothetical protein